MRTKILSVFLLLFYIAIIMYVFFAVIHIDVMENFVTGMIFEIIGFFALLYFILCNFGSKPIRTGYFVPLVMVTIIYTILLDIVNIAFVAVMGRAVFTLLNLVLLFLYCFVSVPMYIMGKDK